MNKIAVLAFALLLPTVGFAKPKPTPAPTPKIEIKVDYNSLLNKAEEAIDSLIVKLDSAIIKIASTQVSLNKVTDDLNLATLKTQELQVKIDEETELLNITREDLNKQIKEVNKWKEKCDVIQGKLNGWRKIALAFTTIVTLYFVFLIARVIIKLKTGI